MRKTSIVRYDKERGKFRVDTGERLNTYVARRDDIKSAVAISVITDKVYKEGYKDGHKRGYKDGYAEAMMYVTERLHDFNCELEEELLGRD